MGHPPNALIDEALWQRIIGLHDQGHKKIDGALSMNHYNVRFLALALCGEAGELANIIKKQWRGLPADQEANWGDARDEVADIVIYSLLLYCALGGDPVHQDGLRANMMRKLDKFERKLNGEI